jgi:hypothetical protein
MPDALRARARAVLWGGGISPATRPTVNRNRLEATKLLADRGWGKAAAYEPQEDPFDLEEMEAAAEEFRKPALSPPPMRASPGASMDV